MASAAKQLGARHRTWRSYFRFAVGTLVVLGLLVGAWALYTGISVSLQAEENLHATLFAIRLVEQFVHEHGRWPKSWSELEKMTFPSEAPSPLNGDLTVARIGGAHGYVWPNQSPHLQECVVVDFTADVNTIINQPPIQFNAIKPNGPYYEYRDYGFVDSLRETLRHASSPNVEAKLRGE